MKVIYFLVGRTGSHSTTATTPWFIENSSTVRTSTITHKSSTETPEDIISRADPYLMFGIHLRVHAFHNGKIFDCEDPDLQDPSTDLYADLMVRNAANFQI